MINMSNDITLKSVRNLLGMEFFIPSYQRGYRWTEQQVKDLLNDIKEFIDNGTNIAFSHWLLKNENKIYSRKLRRLIV